MDEEFGSFVVTDPDLVDPSIDVSGLRTQTDTSLLGNIPDFAGIQYEAFNPTRLTDLMRLYETGLPMIDTPTAAVPPATSGGGGETGDGGQAAAPITTPTQPDSIAGFDPGVTPGASGFIGLDPDMDIDPRDIDDYGTYIPPTTPVDNTINIEGTETFTAPTFEGDVTYQSLINQTTPDLKPIQDLPMAQEPLDIPTQDVGLAYTGEFDPDDEGTVFDTSGLTDATPEQRNTIQNILTAAGDNVKGALTELSKIPGAVVDFANQTVDFFGKKLNVGKTLASIALNKIAGGPVSLLFDAIPEYEPTFQQRTLTDELGLTDDRKFAGNPTTSAFAGLNAFGQFGDPVKTAKDKIDTRLKNIENKNYGPGDKFYDDTQTMIEEYNRVTNKLGDIDAIPTGDAQIAEETIGTLPEITEARQEQGEQIQEIQQQEVVQSGSDEADRQQRDTGVAKVAENRYETKSGDVYASAAEAAEKSDGGGGSGSSGKIVCTMMNESYGFGSFRNKIWLRHSKGLAPEYQKGYHKIFLPLVRLSKKNIVLKKILEHIAVHRTIDIRQESRGKVHLLGRVYRKILEPICYWVGRHG